MSSGRFVIAFAPYRCSLLGGSSDQPWHHYHYGGAVLSTTINYGIRVIISERPKFGKEKPLMIQTRDGMQECDWVGEILDGRIREILRFSQTEKIEFHSIGDFTTRGSGVGGSESFVVAGLLAASTFNGENWSVRRLAETTSLISIDLLGQPIGVQDQTISAWGGFRLLRLIPGDSPKDSPDISAHDLRVEVETPRISSQTLERLDHNLLYFFTGQTRDVAEPLQEQKETVSGEEKIRIRQQMAAGAMTGKKLLEDLEIFPESDRIVALDEFGNLLHQEWELKKQLGSKVTTSKIDQAYAEARKAGAIGGKLSGGGSGGFLLTYVPSECQNSVRRAMESFGFQEMGFHINQRGARVIFNP